MSTIAIADTYTTDSGRVFEILPRHREFFKAYADPSSPTFSNITASGIRAGYSPEYSEQLFCRGRKWLDAMKDSITVKQAERNLNKVLECEPESDTDKKINADMTKFALERLAKDKYSTKSQVEVTGIIGVLSAYDSIEDKREQNRSKAREEMRQEAQAEAKETI